MLTSFGLGKWLRKACCLAIGSEGGQNRQLTSAAREKRYRNPLGESGDGRSLVHFAALGYSATGINTGNRDYIHMCWRKRLTTAPELSSYVPSRLHTD